MWRSKNGVADNIESVLESSAFLTLFYVFTPSAREKSHKFIIKHKNVMDIITEERWVRKHCKFYVGNFNLKLALIAHSYG